MQVVCHLCGKENVLTLTQWRCDCGGALEPTLKHGFNIDLINHNDYSLWRYGQELGLDISKPYKAMGVGWTPLVATKLFNRSVVLKLEYLMPSGSFKDRGVNAMINQLVHLDVKTVVEDSSGNAGASVAAHAACFGIHARIFVPSYASIFKQEQIAVYGAEIIAVSGTRKDTEQAAQDAIGGQVAYASHAYNPAYLSGQITAAWELWEQLGQKSPDWIILPVAQGGQFLGYWFGFKKLLQAGLINRLPKLVAVQSSRIAPIYKAWQLNLDDVFPIEAKKSTVAEGVAITNPVRGKRLLEALRETNGKVLSIKEEDILRARKTLANKGFYIEPTSALAVAGFHQIRDEIKPGEQVVIPLTGSGLKGEPKQKKEKHAEID